MQTPSTSSIGQSSPNEDGLSGYLKSKLLEAVRSTKESPYVKSLYGETFANVTSTSSNVNNDGMEPIPEDTKIILYPSYTKLDDKEYITRVKGSIFCGGSMSTKNKLLLGLAQRLTRKSAPNNTQLGNQLESQLTDALENPDTTVKGISTENSTNSTILPCSVSSDTVKERMQGILSRQIPKSPLNVTIGSKETVDQLIAAKIYSDNFGMFEISLMTGYEPSYIVVSSVLNPNIIQTVNTELVLEDGISIITDIDDTVRETGVLGDKRDVFRNIFSKPYSECEIPGIRDWLYELYFDYKCSIHYVSNSPWQIYNIVEGFLNYYNFPITSIHLRQYSGNLISSFTQPSAERKRPSMVNLLKDFPKRKFILVGDSGEQDLEAYLSLLPHFQDQIKAIYIRVVPGSLSSLGNDQDVLEELENLLSMRSVNTKSFWDNPTGVDSDDEIYEPNEHARKHSFGKVFHAATDVSAFGSGHRRRRSTNNGITDDLVNNTTFYYPKAKLAPLVPKKPSLLKGNKVEPKTSKTESHIPEPHDAMESTSNPISLIRSRTRSWSKDHVSNILKISEKNHFKSENPIENEEHNHIMCENSHAGVFSKTNHSNPLDLNDKSETNSSGGSSNENSIISNTGNQYSYFNEAAENEDKRRLLWKQKIKRVLDEVPASIEFKLWLNVESLHEESIKIVLEDNANEK